MIHVVEGVRVEVKWRRTNEQGGKEYYGRLADELHSVWQGPFLTPEGAAHAARNTK
jgi:hypothetical protein